MQKSSSFSGFVITLLLVFSILFIGCEKESLKDLPVEKSSSSRIDIGLGDLMQMTDVNVTITPRSHGYIAEARGRGVIPSGEYAGQRFQIVIEGEYSGIGFGTLTSGEALVTIRGERFESVYDPFLQSFCCGEGDLMLIDGEYSFTMFGQVNHGTADEPHNHLFAGFATSEGTMNMNIADQTGTVVIPATPPHDPGIGLIIGFHAQYVRVEEH